VGCSSGGPAVQQPGGPADRPLLCLAGVDLLDPCWLLQGVEVGLVQRQQPAGGGRRDSGAAQAFGQQRFFAEAVTVDQTVDQPWRFAVGARCPDLGPAGQDDVAGIPGLALTDNDIARFHLAFDQALDDLCNAAQRQATQHLQVRLGQYESTQMPQPRGSSSSSLSIDRQSISPRARTRSCGPTALVIAKPGPATSTCTLRLRRC